LAYIYIYIPLLFLLEEHMRQKENHLTYKRRWGHERSGEFFTFCPISLLLRARLF
jgi:hypothetical protein